MATSNLSKLSAASPELVATPGGSEQSQASRAAADSPVLFGAVALLLFGPLAFGAVEPWSALILEAGTGLLFVVWIFRHSFSGELQIAGNPLFKPMLAFGTLVVIQIAFGTTAYRQQTVSSALLYIAYGLLCFLVVQTLRRTQQVKLLAYTFSSFGFLVACFAIVQSMSSNGKLYWIRAPRFGGWIYGPYVNHNHYAGLMELLMPIPLVIAASHRATPLQKIMAGVAAVLMAATIFLSGSRGGMAAFAIQIAVFAAVVLRQQGRGRAALALGVFLVLLGGMLAWLGGGEVTKRLASISSETHTELSGGVRMDINRDGLKMARQKPLLGWGLGNFSVAYPKFRSFYTNFFINEAHDDYLQMLIEMGVLGFVTMLWFVIATYRAALKKLSDWPTDTNGALAFAAMLGVTGILVHSFLDFNLQVPANAALFYVLCVVAAMEPRFGLVRRRTRKPDILIPTTD